MKLSDELQQMLDSGDFGLALIGCPEKAKDLELDLRLSRSHSDQLQEILDDYADESPKIKDQRDQLLEALEMAREDIILYRLDAGLEPEGSVIVKIDAAIAAAKGQ